MPPKNVAAPNAVKLFNCKLCDKGYPRQTEYENHLRSYDHNHRQRLADMKKITAANDTDKSRPSKRGLEEMRSIPVDNAGSKLGLGSRFKRVGDDAGQAAPSGFKKVGVTVSASPSGFKKVGVVVAGSETRTKTAMKPITEPAQPTPPTIEPVSNLTGSTKANPSPFENETTAPVTDMESEEQAEEQNAEEQNAEEQSAEEQNAEEQSAEEQNAEEQTAEEQNAEEQTAEEQNAEEQNAEEQNVKEQNVEEHNAEDAVMGEDEEDSDEVIDWEEYDFTKPTGCDHANCPGCNTTGIYDDSWDLL